MGKRQNNRVKKEFFDKQNERQKQKKFVCVNQEEKSNAMRSNLEYVNFFLSNNKKKIILYDEFPNLDTIIKYYSDTAWNKGHPLEEYGKFEIKELVEIIKVLYSIKRQEDYKVLTTGCLIKKSCIFLGEIFSELVPNIYFLVGNNKTLADYLSYQNLFMEEEKNFCFDNEYLTNFISISPNKGIIRDTLGITCDCLASDCGYYEGIQYFDSIKNKYASIKFISIFNILDNNFNHKINNYKGIQDTLVFPIHPNDEFIAKVLLSIVIYKSNCGIHKLSNDDYRVIFYELFKENVNIDGEIKKDIPKKLKYVRNK